jgi:hypothetical protein
MLIATLPFGVSDRNSDRNFDWTIPEAANAYMFRTDIQYALNLDPENRALQVRQRSIRRCLFGP